MRLIFQLDTDRQSTPSPGVGSFFGELAPYLRALLVDFVISASLWLALFSFQWLTYLFPIKGVEGETARFVHSLSTILAFPTFGVKFIIDVVIISKKQNHS